MRKEQIRAVFTWFQEHNIVQHVTFCSILSYIVSVTGLAMGGGVGFLILNILSGLWLIEQVYTQAFVSSWMIPSRTHSQNLHAL